MRDIHNNLSFKVALKTTKVFRNTVDDPFVNVTGNIIDIQGFRSLEFVILSGDLVDGVYRPIIEHGDEPDLSDRTPVPGEELLGEEDDALAFGSSSDNEIRKVGYIGSKRYVRLSMAAIGYLAGGTVSAVAILGEPLQTPV